MLIRYLQAMKKMEMLVRDGAEPPLALPEVSEREDELQEVEDEKELNPMPDTCPSTFAHLQFCLEVKARGRPKRLKRQLCSFNRTSADAATTRSTT